MLWRYPMDKIGLMERIKKVLLLLLGLALPVSTGLSRAGEMVFYGASDVSTAVFLDGNRFAAADDETNQLRIYDIRVPEKPVSSLDLTAFLAVESDHPEADLEGSARVDDRIYWITSHGRNKDGKPRPNRYRFFCTTVKTDGDSVRLEPAGKPCRTLVEQLLAQSSPIRELIAKTTRLDEPLKKKEEAKLAPKEGGLNIEGLAVYPPHQSLLIGLRNPLFSPSGKKGGDAIVIELLNPKAVVDEGAGAQFGKVLFWDLEDRGVRGMHYSMQHGMFFILAGAVDSETLFALYRWDGDFETAPALMLEWPKTDSFNPETIAERPADGMLRLFSDDGTLEIPVDSPGQCQPGELLKNNLCPNKYLIDPLRKTFRVRTLNP